MYILISCYNGNIQTNKFDNHQYACARMAREFNAFCEEWELDKNDFNQCYINDSIYNCYAYVVHEYFGERCDWRIIEV